MKNKNLLIISIVLFVLSQIILIRLIYLEPVNTMNIGEINRTHLDKLIKINGIVEEIKTYENFYIIKLKDDSGSISVLFDKKLDFGKKENLTVIGNVLEYNKRMEIKANLIYVN
jgi:aspartyl-tRNA synthetase